MISSVYRRDMFERDKIAEEWEIEINGNIFADWNVRKRSLPSDDQY